MRGNKVDFISLHGYSSNKEMVININSIIKVFNGIDDKGISFTHVVMSNGEYVKVRESIKYIKNFIGCYE